ncbi:MAG: FAD-binding oxidoreductase, partial [Rhodospirillaceae bacterium]|nr:FAD-binding oxidoreductase [Rhodospirillaceae bacterium]
HSPAALAAVEQRARQWERRGAPAVILDRKALAALLGSEAYLGGWLDRRGGGIQPLSYARGLAAAAADRGARIYTRSPALRVRREGNGWRVETPAGAVTADTIVIPTNAYTDDLWPGLRQSVVPVFSLQIATDPLPEALRRSILPEGQVASDTLRLLRYFRIDGAGRFVLGARGPFREEVTLDHAGEQIRHVRRLFPQLEGVRFTYVWTGRVAMTADHLPHLHVLAPGAFTALGYNGRGVALTTTMGRLLAALASGTPAEAIDFPVTALRSLPLHAFNRLGVRLLTQYYRLRDRFG